MAFKVYTIHCTQKQVMGKSTIICPKTKNTNIACKWERK